MNILFQDKYLVVCEKAPGIPSQADSSQKASMISLLSEECKSDIFCVHRLDTPTGGIMVYAKDSKTAGKLTASLSSESSKKEYICAVHKTGMGSGRMEDLLWHDKRQNRGYVVDRERKGTKSAILDYETLSENGEISLMKVTLKTGRTHQIRIQFSSRKAPLVGDGKYGARDNCPLALYCFHLCFVHPITKKQFDFVHLPDSPWFSFELNI